MSSFDPDPRFRAAKSLRRVSIATRVLGILVIIGAIGFLLVALDMNNSGDRVGFSLIALGVILFGVLVWGTGTFHRAVADALPMLGEVVDKLDQLSALSSTRVPLPNPAAAPAPAAPSPVVAPALLASPPSAPNTPILESEPNAESTESAPDVAADRAPPAGVRAPENEPAQTPCPHCGGLIHPEASRCVHCMKKVRK